MAQKDSLQITTLFRGRETRVCHNDKEVEKAIAEGYELYNPAKADYPRTLYKATEKVRVESVEEEAGYKAQGWSRVPSAEYGQVIAPAAVSAPASTASTVAHSIAIADLDARVTALAARVAELEGKKKATD